MHFFFFFGDLITILIFPISKLDLYFIQYNMVWGSCGWLEIKHANAEDMLVISLSNL